MTVSGNMNVDAFLQPWLTLFDNIEVITVMQCNKCKKIKIHKKLKQAGAKLCQAQIKLCLFSQLFRKVVVVWWGVVEKGGKGRERSTSFHYIFPILFVHRRMPMMHLYMFSPYTCCPPKNRS